MDPISAVGGIAGIVVAGAKMSVQLYEIAETISSAKRDIEVLATSFNFYSMVLRQADSVIRKALKHAAASEILKGSGEALDAVAKATAGLLKESDELIESLKAVATPGAFGARIKAQFTKLRWLFQRSRIEVLNTRVGGFTVQLNLLLNTVNVELAILDKLAPEVIATLQVQKLGSMKAVEAQEVKIKEVVEEAKKQKAQVTKASPSEDVSLALPVLWTPPAEDPDPAPRRAIMQLALMDTSTRPTTPPPSYQFESGPENRRRSVFEEQQRRRNQEEERMRRELQKELDEQRRRVEREVDELEIQFEQLGRERVDSLSAARYRAKLDELWREHEERVREFERALYGDERDMQPNLDKSRDNSPDDPELFVPVDKEKQTPITRKVSQPGTYLCKLGCNEDIPILNRKTHEALHDTYLAMVYYKSNNPTHLSFEAGDAITEVGSPPMKWWQDANILPSPDWLWGTLYGKRGAFPGDRVRGYFDDADLFMEVPEEVRSTDVLMD